MTYKNDLGEIWDPRKDGFMRAEEVIQSLAGGYSMRTDEDGECVVALYAGKVRSETIELLMRQGWIERGNLHWRLTDEGRKAYLRSTDELGDGKLRSPASGSDEHG